MLLLFPIRVNEWPLVLERAEELHIRFTMRVFRERV